MNKTENTEESNNAAQLTDISVPSVKKTDSLGKVLNVIMKYDVDKVAVTDEENKTLGYIRSRDVFAAYAKQSKASKS
ncbi:MAG: CBS domain-containing protein [Bacteroidota bacterium]